MRWLPIKYPHFSDEETEREEKFKQVAKMSKLRKDNFKAKTILRRNYHYPIKKGFKK